MSQRIAIVGYGVEGESAYRYIRSTWADAAVTIFVDAALPKEPPTGVDVKAGDIAQADLRGYEIVFRSPSVRPDRIHTDGRVTSVTNEFLRVAGTNRVIGVTGSKGKGTTTSLIYEILKAAGITARLAGNIGVPALNLLPLKPDEWVILELSSFQLWDIEASPHIAVLLMMESDHLDVHTDMNEYIAAPGCSASRRATPPQHRTRPVAAAPRHPAAHRPGRGRRQRPPRGHGAGTRPYRSQPLPRRADRAGAPPERPGARRRRGHPHGDRD